MSVAQEKAVTIVEVPEGLQKRLSPVVQEFLDERAELEKWFAMLKARPLSPMTAELAVEWDSKAKAFEQKITDAFEPTVAVLHNTHRAATGVRAAMLAPVKPLRNLCSSLLVRWKLEQEKTKEVAPAAERAAVSERVDRVLSGVSMTPKWCGLVKDFNLLVKHIAANPNLLFLLQVNQVELNDYLTKMQGQVELPGVTVEETFQKANRN